MINYTCMERNMLIAQFQKIKDIHNFSNEKPSDRGFFKSYQARWKFLNDDSDKYINVSVAAFRSFLTIKFVYIPETSKSEHKLFKLITKKEKLGLAYEIYYDDINLLVTRLDSIDIYSKKSGLVFCLEFQDIQSQQDFKTNISEYSLVYSSREIKPVVEENTETSLRAIISEKSRSKLYCSFK